MTMEKPAPAKDEGSEEAKRDAVKSNKEQLKDLAAGEAHVKGGGRIVADPDDGGE